MEDVEKRSEVIERLVTPEELARILINTLKETIYQNAAGIIHAATGIQPGDPTDQVQEDISRIETFGRTCCRQIIQLEQIAQKGLRGEPIPIQPLSDPESLYFKEIIALPPTSEHK